MKNPKHLYLLSLVFLLSACLKKEDPPPIPILMGDASGVLNGESKPFEAYAVKTNGRQQIRLEIDGQTDPNDIHPLLQRVRHNISFSQIPLKTGVVRSFYNISYPNLPNRSYCSYTVAKGDTVYAFYNLIENHPDNHFEITDIDEKTHLVKGTFDISLTIEPGFNAAGEVWLADTIRLSGGSFEAPFWEVYNE
jgi:hypothetical protein